MYLKKFFIALLSISMLVILSSSTRASAESYPFVLLSSYSETVDIGDEFYLLAVTTNAKVTWKSSNSRVASVNTYGLVTAKSAGVAKITAKIKGAETTCVVNVRKTQIKLSSVYESLERNEAIRLKATTSNHSPVTFKSNRKSVASVNENGIILAHKPGDAIITVKADGTEATCKITVRKPTVKLNQSTLSMYKNASFKLNAFVSSGVPVTWKTNKKSVATVDENGYVTAIKNGTATITATVDGVSRSCKITVVKPTITLNYENIIIREGMYTSLKATVSSKNPVSWSSSNSNVVEIDEYGVVHALKCGKAYIYAKEDGAKARCIVQVIKE